MSNNEILMKRLQNLSQKNNNLNETVNSISTVKNNSNSNNSKNMNMNFNVNMNVKQNNQNDSNYNSITKENQIGNNVIKDENRTTTNSEYEIKQSQNIKIKDEKLDVKIKGEEDYEEIGYTQDYLDHIEKLKKTEDNSNNINYYTIIKEKIKKIPRHYYDPYYNSDISIRIGWYCLCFSTIIVFITLFYSMF